MDIFGDFEESSEEPAGEEFCHGVDAGIKHDLMFTVFSDLPADLRITISSFVSKRDLLSLGCASRASNLLVLHPSLWIYERPLHYISPEVPENVHNLSRTERRNFAKQHANPGFGGRRYTLNASFFASRKSEPRFRHRIRYSVAQQIYNPGYLWFTGYTHQLQVRREIGPMIAVAIENEAQANAYLRYVCSYDSNFPLDPILKVLFNSHPLLLHDTELLHLVMNHNGTPRELCRLSSVYTEALARIGSKLCLPAIFKRHADSSLTRTLEDAIGVEAVLLLLLARDSNPEDTLESLVEELVVGGPAKEGLHGARSYALMKIGLPQVVSLLSPLKWEEHRHAIIEFVVVFLDHTGPLSDLMAPFLETDKICKFVKMLVLAVLVDVGELSPAGAYSLAVTLGGYPYAMEVVLTEPMRQAISFSTGWLCDLNPETSPIWVLEGVIRRKQGEVDRQVIDTFLNTQKWENLGGDFSPPVSAGSHYHQGWGCWRTMYRGNTRLDISGFGLLCRVIGRDIYISTEDQGSFSAEDLEETRQVACSAGFTVLPNDMLELLVDGLVSRRFGQLRQRTVEEYLFYWED